MTSNTEYMMAGQLDAEQDFQAASIMGKRAFGLKTSNGMIGSIRSEGKSLKMSEKDCHSPMKRTGLQLSAKEQVKDKENTIPELKLTKQKFEAKVVRKIGQQSRPPIQKNNAPASGESQTRTSFSLTQFNSVSLGRRLKIEDRPHKKRSIFTIRASRPTDCSVSLPGLTIRVKIAN